MFSTECRSKDRVFNAGKGRGSCDCSVTRLSEPVSLLWMDLCGDLDETRLYLRPQSPGSTVLTPPLMLAYSLGSPGTADSLPQRQAATPRLLPDTQAGERPKSGDQPRLTLTAFSSGHSRGSQAAETIGVGVRGVGGAAALLNAKVSGCVT